MLIVTDLRFHQNKIDIEGTYDSTGVIFSKNTEENIFCFAIYIKKTVLKQVTLKSFLSFHLKM